MILRFFSYARHNGGIVSQSAIADLWTKLSNEWGGNPNVIFGIMNEPHSMSTEVWRDLAQAAIDAIRANGANNLIFVPGNAWTGAHSWFQSWYGTPNADVMGSITDPLENIVYEVRRKSVYFFLIHSFRFINILMVTTLELDLDVVIPMEHRNCPNSRTGQDSVVRKDFWESLLEEIMLSVNKPSKARLIIWKLTRMFGLVGLGGQRVPNGEVSIQKKNTSTFNSNLK